MIYSLLALLGVAALGARRALTVRMERGRLGTRDLGPDGIIRGAEPITIERPGAPAVLLVHGGGDTPQTLVYVAERLAAEGYAVRAPLLPGHGRTLRALRDVSADAWMTAVRDEYDALRRQHPWVAVVGVSMGGALAIRLAAETHDIPALVLVVPYAAMPPAARRTATLAAFWGLLFPYIRTAQPGRSILDPVEASRSLGYGAFSARGLRALKATVDAAAAALPRVQSPALVLNSRGDNRITPASADAIFAALGSPEKRHVWLEGAGHVITVDFGHERVCDEIASWLTAHRPMARATA